VIPIIFKVTGQETIDVVTLAPGKYVCNAVTVCPAGKDISTQIVKIPIGVTTKVRLAVRNTGDIPIWDVITQNTPGLQSALGINGLTPSAITSPNIPQTLFSTIVPVGIVGGSKIGFSLPFHYHPQLPPNTLFEYDVNVFPTHYVAGTIELLNIQTAWNNVLGFRVSQTNQIYFEVTPAP
jgi:hypothetical protein